MAILLLTMAVLTLAGCVAGEQEIPAPKPEPGAVEVELAINIRSADNPMSRADYDLDKTPEECKITSVSIFLVPVANVAGTYVEDWTNAQYRMVFNPEIIAGYYYLSFKMTAAAGKKHIYAAANMSHAQTLAFMDTDGAYLSTGTTYKTVVDEFATATSGGKGIVMIAQLTEGGEEEIDLSASGNLQTDDIDLIRVVSKVMMVCETDNTIEGAMPTVDYGIATDDLAWVRLEHVYFAIDPTGKVLYREATSPPDQFVNIIMPPTNPPSTDEWKQTVKYEAHRIGQANAGSDEHYVDGLYCLANQASASATGTSTELVVCVRYLPRTFITGYSAITGKTITRFDTEAEGWAALAVPTNPVDENGNAVNDYSFPEGTYWIFDKQFYTYQGMIETIRNAPIIENIQRADFAPYLEGRGYYAADIDPSKDLLRNYYYILTVTEFGIPRHTLDIPDGGEMLINSLKMKWVPKGTQAIIVKPE